jgi:hypothetical protein
MIVDFSFPISDVTSNSSSDLGMDNIPNNKSFKPYLLALERNFSLQMGHSSAYPQKGITLIVFKSVIFDLRNECQLNKDKLDKT